MSKLQVFDPAMCCSTGVCGPSVDPALPRFAADLEWLKSKGLEVERYNLAQEVAAFTSNPVVKTALNSRGSKCLPLLLLDGTIVAEGAYPTREELASLAQVEFEPGPVITQVKGTAAIRNNWRTGQVWSKVSDEPPPRSDSQSSLHGKGRRGQDFDCLCHSRFTR